jgi:hypothetical protein
MEHVLSGEADSRPGCIGISLFLWTPDVHYRIQKRRPLHPTLDHSIYRVPNSSRRPAIVVYLSHSRLMFGESPNSSRRPAIVVYLSHSRLMLGESPKTSRHLLTSPSSSLFLITFSSDDVAAEFHSFSVEQNISWETDSLLAGQEIPRVLWNHKIYYRVRNSTPLDHILSQFNPNHIVTVYLTPFI